jgi:hypothetical protein
MLSGVASGALAKVKANPLVQQAAVSGQARLDAVKANPIVQQAVAAGQQGLSVLKQA